MVEISAESRFAVIVAAGSGEFVAELLQNLAEELERPGGAPPGLIRTRLAAADDLLEHVGQELPAQWAIEPPPSGGSRSP
jgi:hypothetical protein